jgi:FkbM family methyltransferase
MANLIKILRFILSHPLNQGRKWKALKTFVSWQIGQAINPYPSLIPFGSKSKLLIKKGMTGATGNLYTGLHEFEDMSFILHFLRSSDLFIDIGANIGSYSILAAVEKEARTIAFEPIITTYDFLKQNISINNVTEKVETHCLGLGSKFQTLSFTSTLDTMNHVDEHHGNLQCRIEPFDYVVGDLTTITLIKIDVEGYEMHVLQGMEKALQSDKLKVIIIELNGSGMRYGYSDNEIDAFLKSKKFKAFSYQPFTRTLVEWNNNPHPGANRIYLRELNFVEERLNNSEKIFIFGKSL